MRTRNLDEAIDAVSKIYCPAGPRRDVNVVLEVARLTSQPHHCSQEEMAETVPTPVPGVVRRAERYMSDNAGSAIAISDVAAHVGVSVRSLQTGFRQWRNTTPNVWLRKMRLRLVRDALLQSGAGDSVTSVALRYGFSHLGRFSAYYQEAFGEAPSATRRHSRTRLHSDELT